jgi:hypothetical protein
MVEHTVGVARSIFDVQTRPPDRTEHSQKGDREGPNSQHKSSLDEISTVHAVPGRLTIEKFWF